MKSASLQIEEIVREVLRRIELHGGQPAEVEAVPELSDETSAVCTAPTPRQLELTGRVVSLRDVEGKLGGVQHVTAVADAVVTPAARDYLTQHHIQMTFRPPDVGPQRNSALYLAAFATPFDTQQLCDDLAQRGMRCRLTEGGALPTILHLLAPKLAVGATALLVTEEPHVALCAANRHTSIRAFIATDRGRLTKVREAIGGNLLIIDRAQSSDPEIREMADEMVRHRACIPAKWRAVL